MRFEINAICDERLINFRVEVKVLLLLLLLLFLLSMEWIDYELMNFLFQFVHSENYFRLCSINNSEY